MRFWKTPGGFEMGKSAGGNRGRRGETVVSRNEAFLMRVARAVAEEYARDPRVVSILLTGSLARGQVDRHSDIDMMIGYAELPSPERMASIRDAALESGGGVYSFDAENGMAIYRFVEGVKVDLGHQRADELTERIEAFLAEPSVDDTTQHIIMSGVACGIAMHGVDRIAAWQGMLAEFPEGFDEVLVRHNLRFPPRAVLQGMGVERRDYGFVYELVLAAEQSLLGLLCGLNRVYPPGKIKGIAHTVSEMTVKPARAAERLLAIWTLPPAEAVLQLEDLFLETLDLVDAQMPQVDTRPARERLDLELRKAS